MDRDQYFVVLHKGEWKIKHNGRHSQLRDPGRVILIMARILADGSILTDVEGIHASQERLFA